MNGAHNAIHGGLDDGRMIRDCNLHDGWINMSCIIYHPDVLPCTLHP